MTGNDIPFLARIVSVCDAYDAMAFTRQYREGLGHARAIGALQEHAGSQWDESIVAAVIDCLHESTSGSSPLDSVGRNVVLDDDVKVSMTSA